MSDEHHKVAVAADEAVLTDAAAQLARELNLPCCAVPCTDYPYVLVYRKHNGAPRLELRATAEDAPGPVYVDFVAGALGFRARHGSRGREPLARAVGLKGASVPTVLDATAGLGRDAFMLATLGCTVTMVERSPLIAALLRDGLARAAAHAGTRDSVQRMTILVGDGTAILEQWPVAHRPDVVYLDPMYPQRGKTALVKKEMRLLRALVGEDRDAPQLLAAALRAARKRVVVKRPRRAAPLPGSAPSHQLTGSTTRFDIYLPPPAANGG